jgi:mono/diheme cytochrome c family protein
MPLEKLLLARADAVGVASFGPISDPKDLGPVLKKAVAIVTAGGPALVDVVSQEPEEAPMAQRPFFAMLFVACVDGAGGAHGQAANPPGDAGNGKRVCIAVGCSQCHGTIGQGSRPTGPHIAPDPMPYEAFAGLVRHPPNIMPPYTTVVLSDQQLTDIYAYLLTIPPLIDPKAAAILDH